MAEIDWHDAGRKAGQELAEAGGSAANVDIDIIGFEAGRLFVKMAWMPKASRYPPVFWTHFAARPNGRMTRRIAEDTNGGDAGTFEYCGGRMNRAAATCFGFTAPLWELSAHVAVPSVWEARIETPVSE